MIYLDYNATTPCDPDVVAAMLPYFTQKFGNAASRTHPYGWIADEGVEQARRQVATLINADASEVIFTSGATESCNLAIKGVYELYAVKGNHIITCATEHKAVLDSCSHIVAKGAEVTVLGVDEAGLISLDELEAAIKPTTVLIALMYANNETGVLQQIKAIGALAKKHNVLFFTDATQAVGKVKVDVIADDIDILALSGHKLYGPKGVGALYIRRRGPRVRLAAQIDGGGHERGFRSGTLNVPGIVGLGKACSIAATIMEAEAERLAALRDDFEVRLVGLGGQVINGHPKQRLPHVSNMSFGGTTANRMISALNGQLAFAAGSACTSASKEPSHVLAAMGLEETRLFSALRFSFGRFTTQEEINTAIAAITGVLDTTNLEKRDMFI